MSAIQSSELHDRLGDVTQDTTKPLALSLLLMLVVWLLARLSLKTAYRIGAALGLFGYVFSTRSRRNIQNNLAVVLRSSPSSARVRFTALQAFVNNGRNWVDSLRLEGTQASELERRVRVETWSLMQEVLLENRGVILLGMHLGNIDLVGQLVAARGYPVTIPVEVVKPPALFAMLQRLRRHFGIRTVEAETSARHLLRALSDGDIVAVMIDRNLSPSGLKVDVFGREAVVSRGPAWLISKSAAPVLIGAAIRQGNGAFDGDLIRLTPQRTGDLKSDERANAQLIMRHAENFIRRHPEQWAMFAPFW